MTIKTLEVAGIGPAVHAMRNPFDSWEKSDTLHGRIGPKDMELSEKLAKAGPAHAKHLRLIQVWAEIWAPRYWWQEFDTNRFGVEKLSCSTIHRLTARPLAVGDFEWSGTQEALLDTIERLNALIDCYRLAGTRQGADAAFRILKQALPEGYIQRRTVMMSYQALRNVYELRAGHRLPEWRQFRSWCETLPESWMITGILPETSKGDEDDE